MTEINVNKITDEWSSQFDGEHMDVDDLSKFNKTDNLSFDVLLQNWFKNKLSENRPSDWNIIIIILYCLIVIISFFGNTIVCKIVILNPSMRSTTNIFIGNLSASDILMTLFNIPLKLTEILSKNWPLGQFLCKCLPFFRCLSVNVSSFTMACIALDRYQVIAHPLKPRPGVASISLKLILIWVLASLVSLPYSVISGVVEDFTYIKITRCKLIYPQPIYKVRLISTIVTMIIQYLAPLSITGLTYFKICRIIWRRRAIGEILEQQRRQRYLEKWKTIKMLIIVFTVFTVCWFPLYSYHIYQDYRGNVGPHKHKGAVLLVCHWVAMSSICYNPFLYCWLNKGFRNAAKSYLRFIPRIKLSRSTETTSHSLKSYSHKNLKKATKYQHRNKV